MFETKKDFLAALSDLPAPQAQWQEAARQRQGELTKPPGSLGQLEEIAIFLAGWGRDQAIKSDAVKVVIFAGNHGVVAQGVSPYPSDVTKQMVANFSAGGAAINALTNEFGLGLDVIPIDLETPTADITKQPALSEEEALAALNIGAEVVGDDLDLLCLGEMGIGNTTIAAALAAASFGGTGVDWAGPGTGLDADGVSHKAGVIAEAVKRHHTNIDTAFDILCCLGGRETAAIAGAVLAARHKRVPVMLDGYVVTASVAPLYFANADIASHCLAGHVSAEPAHQKLLAHMTLQPLLNLGMRLGEGSGAALAAQVVKAAVATHNKMATFSEAAVSNRTEEVGDV